MAFPNKVHTDQLDAANDLLSKAASAGYTAPDTDLGERGLVISILANLLKDVVTDSVTGLTSSGTLAITAPGTAGAVQVIGTNGVLVNQGSPIKGIRLITQSLTPTPITAAAANSQEQLFTAGGLSNITAADVIFVNKPTQTTFVTVGGARVAGAGTIGIVFGYGATTVTPGGELYSILAIRT
jgi:hypothetical protein